jgi:hypothetical protein
MIQGGAASMDEDEGRKPGQPETRRKSDQEIVVAANRSTTTVTVPAAPAAGQTSGGQPTQLKGDALGEQIFVSGTPGGALSCGSCHTM